MKIIIIISSSSSIFVTTTNNTIIEVPVLLQQFSISPVTHQVTDALHYVSNILTLDYNVFSIIVYCYFVLSVTLNL